MDVSTKALVGIVMGSANDRAEMDPARVLLEEFEVPHEVRVISAHRTPDEALGYAASARARGIEVLIAGAGAAAALPGLLAAKTTVPVLGVPLASSALNGIDALFSMVQMPKGVPVGTLAIGKSGAANAALLAIAILANARPELAGRLDAWRDERRKEVLASSGG